MIKNLMRKSKKYIGVAVVVLTTLVFLFQPTLDVPPPDIGEIRFLRDRFETSQIQEWINLRNNTYSLSKLGRVLFLGEEVPLFLNTNTKKYQILVWKYGSTIESRHLKQFSDKKVDPFEHCSVKNCDITYKDADIKSAAIVIFHLHRFKGINDLPKYRNSNQIWAFLTDESPYNTFLHSKVKMNDFNGIFNWSMTYRMDSDIPVPYGRTILKKNPHPVLEISLTKRRDVLVVILGSNCKGQNHRWEYVKELQKHIQVDVYGGCGPLKSCPGHFRSDCPSIDRYLFYLSFENSNCDEYITEKLWWNAFMKNSIPIVMGASTASYKKLLPIDSFINVEDFASPAVLAQFLIRLNNTGEFENYFKWKRSFEVLNEHGYFKSESYHYCRVCQALNYNNKTSKVYNNLEDFWSVKKNCHPAWNS